MQTALDFLVSHTMEEREVRVWSALRTHEGSARAIKASDLADLVGLSERNTQRAIHELIHRHRKPVCSSMAEPFGYYVATSAAEREEGSRLLRDRAIAMLETASIIEGISRAEYVRRHQLELGDAA